MGNYATPTSSGSGGGGGGGGGLDPQAVHTLTFQGVVYTAEGNSIVLPTLLLPTKTSDLTNDSGFLTADDLAPVSFTGSYLQLIDKPDLSALATAIQSASNVGDGNGLFLDKVNTDLRFKSIKAGANVTITSDGTTVTIASAGGGGGTGGEANTSSNLGTGVGLAAPKNGVNLPFKSLVGSAGLSWSSDANTVTANLDATLQGLGALVVAADQFIYGTGADTFALGTITSYARTLLDDANPPAARATLGSTTIGDAVFVAASTIAAQSAIGIVNKVRAYKQDGTKLDISVNVDGSINATAANGTVYKIPVEAA